MPWTSETGFPERRLGPMTWWALVLCLVAVFVLLLRACVERLPSWEKRDVVQRVRSPTSGQDAVVVLVNGGVFYGFTVVEIEEQGGVVAQVMRTRFNAPITTAWDGDTILTVHSDVELEAWRDDDLIGNTCKA